MGNSASTARIPVNFSPKAKPQRLRATDTINLLVLIGGTTQPVNLGGIADGTSDPGGTRSQGHSDDGVSTGSTDYWGMRQDQLVDANLSDLDWYWQEDYEFRKAVAALSQDYLSFRIFAAHGWSGDNAIVNRQVAGAYLANRLCGGEGEKAYYPAWRHKSVHIHLMGHSHGGNVVNEFLQQAAKLGTAWPARWRIRSVTYLSTPFFQRLHPLNTATFDPECRIINVTDDYDLTQRVVADFSMLPLRNVLLHVKADALLERLDQFPWDETVVDAAIGSVNVDGSFQNYLPKVEIVLGQKEGNALYDQLIDVVNHLEGLVQEAHRVVEHLTTPFTYPVVPGLKGKVKTERSILSKDSAQRIQGLLRSVWEAGRPLREQLQARRAIGRYPVMDVLGELLSEGSSLLVDLLDKVGTLIAIDRNKLEGPLCNLLVAFALDQVDEFDDTVRSPAAQLEGTPFAQRLDQVDVSMSDEYRADPDLSKYWSRFPDFIAKVEASEKAYAERGEQRDVVDLMLRLVAQVSAVRGLVAQYRAHPRLIGGIRKTLAGLAAVSKVRSWFDDGGTTIYEALDRLATSVDTWMGLLAERDAGGMEVPLSVATPTDPKHPPLGSLEHFMYVAHSVSRRQLHPEVETLLRGQITSLRRQASKER